MAEASMNAVTLPAQNTSSRATEQLFQNNVRQNVTNVAVNATDVSLTQAVAYTIVNTLLKSAVERVVVVNADDRVEGRLRHAHRQLSGDESGFLLLFQQRGQKVMWRA